MENPHEKCIAIAEITTPSDVAVRCTTMKRPSPHKGAIWVSIPELGFTGTNLVYCRYGLSVPYIKIENGMKLLVETTYSDSERWFYTGVVDCYGEEPTDTNRMIIPLESGDFSITFGDNITIQGDSDAKTMDITIGDNVTINIDDSAKTVDIANDSSTISMDGTNIDINGSADYAVAFDDLKAEFNKLKNDYNTHTHNYNPGPGSPAATTVTSAVNTSNIDLAKVDDVRLP